MRAAILNIAQRKIKKTVQLRLLTWKNKQDRCHRGGGGGGGGEEEEAEEWLQQEQVQEQEHEPEENEQKEQKSLIIFWSQTSNLGWKWKEEEDMLSEYFTFKLNRTACIETNYSWKFKNTY